MADRKKAKTKRRDKKGGDEMKITKEDYQIGKHLRFKCLTKQSTIMGNEVNYFTGSKAVDCLMQSKWAKGSGCLFSSREACVEYMQSLLVKEFFYRARRLVQKPREKDNTKDKDGTSSQKGTPKPKRDKTKKDADKDTSEAKEKASGKSECKEAESKPGDSKEKEKKKKVKLEYHSDQYFVDGNDAYVWIYDPTSIKTWILGSLIVLGSIGICVFPLWPPEVRLGVYYLSMAAMGFVGVILLLVVIRSILFGFVWLLTLGRHHFWLLPNLTEDCGFFESFKPLYSHSSHCSSKSDSSDKTKDNETKAEDVAKSSDAEVTNKNNNEDQATDSDRDSDKGNNDEEAAASSSMTLRQRKKQSKKGNSGDDAVHSSSSQDDSNSGFELVDTPPSPREERD